MLLEQLHHLSCQLWANSCFFVFEIDETLIPALLCASKVSPMFDVDLIVIFAPQPQISVICSRDFRRSEIFGVGDAERDVPRPEQSEDFVVEPRFMTELECGTHRGKFAKKRAQHVRIFFERGRQLKQNWSESLAQSCHDFAEVSERIRAIAQLRPMRD